ncbi:SMC domain protein, partial [Candidatus Thiomargarita nelsonii]
MSIQYLKISNFKSIDSLELRNINDFSVFAGANGSGKSNFFDALDFVSRFIRFGLTDALRGHGGFDNIHSVKRLENEARRFEFEIECILPDDSTSAQYKYRLVIQALDTEPEINEQLFIDEKPAITRALDPVDYSVLFTFPRSPLSTLLKNVRVYRIEPFGASAPDQSDQDSSLLKRNGHNLPSVLKRLE